VSAFATATLHSSRWLRPRMVHRDGALAVVILQSIFRWARAMDATYSPCTTCIVFAVLHHFPHLVPWRSEVARVRSSVSGPARSCMLSSHASPVGNAGPRIAVHSNWACRARSVKDGAMYMLERSLK
jgi:hypothetical protein